MNVNLWPWFIQLLPEWIPFWVYSWILWYRSTKIRIFTLFTETGLKVGQLELITNEIEVNKNEIWISQYSSVCMRALVQKKKIEVMCLVQFWFILKNVHWLKQKLFLTQHTVVNEITSKTWAHHFLLSCGKKRQIIDEWLFLLWFPSPKLKLKRRMDSADFEDSDD